MFQLLSDNPPLAPIAGPLSTGQQRAYLSDGDQGTAETITVMQKFVSQGKRDDEVRAAIGRILGGAYSNIPECPGKDHLCYAKAIYTFARDNIKYAYDPHLVEYVESARRVLKNGIADCDSIVVLMGAMLENIGLPTQFVTIKADQERPDEFSHVYMRVKIPNVGWIAVDPTMPMKDFGWEAPSPMAVKYWHGSTDEQGPVDQSPSSFPGMFGMRGLSAPRYFPSHGRKRKHPQHPVHPRHPRHPQHPSQNVHGLSCGADCQCPSCAAKSGIPSPYPLAVNDGSEAEMPVSFDSPMAGIGNLSQVDANKVRQAEGAASSIKDTDPGLYDFIKAMWDGSFITRLSSARRQMTIQQQTLLAHQSNTPEWNAAAAAWKQAAAALNNTINTYNSIAQKVNFQADVYGVTDHMAQMSPLAVSSGLGSLGLPAALIPVGEFVVANPLIGVALAAIGLVLIIVGGVLIYELIQMFLQAMGLIDQSSSLINRLANLLEKAALAAEKVAGGVSMTMLTLGGVALAGVAAYVIVKSLKKKGKI